MPETALEEWLLSIGLEKALVEQTITQFKSEDIFTVEDVLKLGDNDLKDLGIKLGTRKKIMEGGKYFGVTSFLPS